MAEVAGLVIGGVGLIALFDTAMSAFDYVDAGKNYGKDYQEAALKISLIQTKLARWRKTVELVDEDAAKDYAKFVAPQDEVEVVRELLASIGNQLKAAEGQAKRSKEPAATDEQSNGDHSVEALTSRVQRWNLERQKKSSVFTKARWALHDKRKFNNLIETLSGFVTELTEMFPGTQKQLVVYANQDAAELSKAAVEVIEPSGIEEPGDEVSKAAASGAAPLALLQAAEAVDPQLKTGLDEVAKSKTGNTYGELIMKGKARGMQGDQVASGYSGPIGGLGGSTYGKVTADDKTRLMQGNKYGGKDFWASDSDSDEDREATDAKQRRLRQG